jgi:hypothetical protein
MDDAEILLHIQKLVDKGHELMGLKAQGKLEGDNHVRMQALEVARDQCWDLLRQRRARRSAGLNPDTAQVRPPEIVERYQQ